MSMDSVGKKYRSDEFLRAIAVNWGVPLDSLTLDLRLVGPSSSLLESRR
jgi:hypothetical protein